MESTAFVTGCAGFIGSHLTDRLLAAGCAVVGYDNFSTGQLRFLEEARRHSAFQLVEGDVLDARRLSTHMRGAHRVFHLAANADVRRGTENTYRDLEQNALGTLRVLEAMRVNGIKQIAFASTASVYGDTTRFPTPEDTPFPAQTSLYGASKLAAEGLIAAYAEAFAFQSWIFRLVSILGERYTHGHVFDFVKQLRAHPGTLHVLGDGKQRKSYLYVHDCIDAMLLALEKAERPVNIFNLGVDSYCQVNDSVGWISGALRASPELSYAGGDRGWSGDNPCIFVDTARMRALGWRPKLGIRESVLRTVDYLTANQWVLEARQ
jgi:UDP-glucose 4-epimerase